MNYLAVRRAADIDPEQAEAVYQELFDKMRRGYALVRLPATDYGHWRRFNRVPYKSAQHGSRHINKYGNARAKNYGRLEPGEQMPVGAVIVKDSFSVGETGGVAPGPLFIMEKMPAGFNAPSNDWRYTMVMPDGSIFGTTKGETAAAVAFCIPCHATQGGTDHLFPIPPQWRASD